MYITGFAISEDIVSRHVQVYSPVDGKWSTLPEAPNYNASIAVISGYITLIGGRDAQTDITNVLSTWSEEDCQWKTIVPCMPTGRLTSGVYCNDGILLVTGGVADSTEERGKLVIVNTVDVYNILTGCWITPKALELPKALRSHRVVFCEGNIYVMGGATTYPAQPEGKEQHFNPEAWRARWSDVKAAVMQPSKRKSVWTPIMAPPVVRSAVVSCKNSLFSVGGVKAGKPQEVIYEFVDGEIVDGRVVNRWDAVGSMSMGQYRHGVVPLGSRGVALFVAGGYVEGDPKEDETNEKSLSVELVLL